MLEARLRLPFPCLGCGTLHVLLPILLHFFIERIVRHDLVSHNRHGLAPFYGAVIGLLQAGSSSKWLSMVSLSLLSVDAIGTVESWAFVGDVAHVGAAREEIAGLIEGDSSLGHRGHKLLADCH